MKIRMGTDAKAIFKNPDFYFAVSQAVTKCISDMQDPAKDPKARRKVKISLEFDLTETPGVYNLQAKVAPVLSPTLCAMEETKQMNISDYDQETGEVIEKGTYS